MELVADGRLAILYMDDQMLAATGSTNNDTEGLINLPLTAREIQAVVFFKATGKGDVRVSMRSKYDVDVRQVASEFGGGGHKNAAGFTVTGELRDVRAGIIDRIVGAIAQGLESRPSG
jgi:phosphoesterase RecJ-like protein